MTTNRFATAAVLLGCSLLVKSFSLSSLSFERSLNTMKPQHQQRQACSYLSAAPDNHHHSNEQDWSVAVQKAFAACFVTASLWISPVALEQSHIPTMISSQAAAKEMASGSGSRVNKDPESLLRYGLPINNKEVRCANSV